MFLKCSVFCTVPRSFDTSLVNTKGTMSQSTACGIKFGDFPHQKEREEERERERVRERDLVSLPLFIRTPVLTD